MPDEGAFEALRTAAEERLDEFLAQGGYDEAAAQALEQTLSSSFEAQAETRSKVAAGELTDQERRSFLQAERLRVYLEARVALGEEGARAFMQQVLGANPQGLGRLEQRATGGAE